MTDTNADSEKPKGPDKASRLHTGVTNVRPNNT